MTKHEKLKQIVNEVFKVDLMSKSRVRRIVEARMVFANIFMKYTMSTATKTGEYINKDHATILHYNKRFDYVIKVDKDLYELYLQCAKSFSDFFDFEGSIHIDIEINKTNKYIYSLQNKIKTLNLEIECLNLEVKSFKTTSKYTENEKKYRSLTRKQREEYDSRVSLILKSFEWKNKNEFETINCQA